MYSSNYGNIFTEFFLFRITSMKIIFHTRISARRIVISGSKNADDELAQIVQW